MEERGNGKTDEAQKEISKCEHHRTDDRVVMLGEVMSVCEEVMVW